jgi:hypothetical protein
MWAVAPKEKESVCGESGSLHVKKLCSSSGKIIKSEYCNFFSVQCNVCMCSMIIV